VIRKIAQGVEGHRQSNFEDPRYRVYCMKQGCTSHFMKQIRKHR